MKTNKSSRAIFQYFLDKITNIAVSTKLDPPTVTGLDTANMYNEKVKKYTFFMPNVSPDEYVDE